MLSEQANSAALVHSYGFNDSKPNMLRPDARGRLQVLAGLELLRNDEVDTLVFTGGQIDPTKPPIADVMAEHAKRILPQKADAIISIPYAHNTAEEVSDFKEEVYSRGFTNLVDIASETHIPRISRAINREFGSRTVTVFSFEEILERNSTRYDSIIDQVVNSSEEKSFRKQERILNHIDSIPYIGPWLLSTLAQILSNKYQLQSSALKRIED